MTFAAEIQGKNRNQDQDLAYVSVKATATTQKFSKLQPNPDDFFVIFLSQTSFDKVPIASEFIAHGILIFEMKFALEKNKTKQC